MKLILVALGCLVMPLVGQNSETLSPAERMRLSQVLDLNFDDLSDEQYLKFRETMIDFVTSKPAAMVSVTKSMLVRAPHFAGAEGVHKFFDISAEYNISLIFCLLSIKNEVEISNYELADFYGRSMAISGRLSNSGDVQLLSEISKMVRDGNKLTRVLKGVIK